MAKPSQLPVRLDTFRAESVPARRLPAVPVNSLGNSPAGHDRRRDTLAPPPATVGRDIPGKQNRLKQLRMFCYTALMGSITKAAERASVTQPAASQQVRSLEREFGLELFERRGPRIMLTAAGRHLYELAMPLVEGIDNLDATFHERFSRSISGAVRIVTEPSAGGFLLPGFLKRFHAQHPGIRLSVKTLFNQPALELLRAHEVDFMIGTNELLPADCEHHSIRASDVMLAVHEHHPLAGHESVSARAVEGYPMILPPSGTHIRHLWDLYAKRYGVRFNVLMETGAAWVVTKFIQNGLGVAVLPSLCVESGGPISLIALAEPFPRLSYGLITHRDMTLSAAARAFIRVMTALDPPAAT